MSTSKDGAKPSPRPKAPPAEAPPRPKAPPPKATTSSQTAGQSQPATPRTGAPRPGEGRPTNPTAQKSARPAGNKNQSLLASYAGPPGPTRESAIALRTESAKSTSRPRSAKSTPDSVQPSVQETANIIKNLSGSTSPRALAQPVVVPAEEPKVDEAGLDPPSARAVKKKIRKRRNLVVATRPQPFSFSTDSRRTERKRQRGSVEPSEPASPTFPISKPQVPQGGVTKARFVSKYSGSNEPLSPQPGLQVGGSSGSNDHWSEIPSSPPQPCREIVQRHTVTVEVSWEGAGSGTTLPASPLPIRCRRRVESDNMADPEPDLGVRDDHRRFEEIKEQRRFEEAKEQRIRHLQQPGMVRTQMGGSSSSSGGGVLQPPSPTPGQSFDQFDQSVNVQSERSPLGIPNRQLKTSVRVLDEVLSDVAPTSNMNTTVSRVESILRRGSAIREGPGAESEGMVPSRHVSFSSAQQEVMQFRVDDEYRDPQTARGPRRVFGGDVQNVVRGPAATLSTQRSSGLKMTAPPGAVGSISQKLPLPIVYNGGIGGHAQGHDGTRMAMRPGIRDLSDTPPPQPVRAPA